MIGSTTASATNNPANAHKQRNTSIEAYVGNMLRIKARKIGIDMNQVMYSNRTSTDQFKPPNRLLM